MILGLCGVAGAGKDSSADFLAKNHAFVKVAFADPLKRIARDVFDFTYEQLWGPSVERNKPDLRYPRDHGPWTDEGKCTCCGVPNEADIVHVQCYLTPRYALQKLGTEWARDCYPDVWALYALRVAEDILHRGLGYSQEHGRNRLGWQDFEPKGVAIPDVRFHSEVAAIRKAGGTVWRIERPGAGLKGGAAAHRSEVEQLAIPQELFAYVLNNKNGPMEDLEKLVTATLHGTLRLFDRK